MNPQFASKFIENFDLGKLVYVILTVIIVTSCIVIYLLCALGQKLFGGKSAKKVKYEW